MQPGDIVLIRSGNAARWGTDAYWHGWCYPDAAAARALVAAGVSGIGFDGPSADPVESADYPLHQVWLSAGVFILENLASLAGLPDRCQLIVAPLKVARGQRRDRPASSHSSATSPPGGRHAVRIARQMTRVTGCAAACSAAPTPSPSPWPCWP